MPLFSLQDIDMEHCKDIPVEQLDLPLRVRNLLRRSGIHELFSLVAAYYGKGLSSYPNIGKQTIDEVSAFLKQLNPDIEKAFHSKMPQSQIQEIMEPASPEEHSSKSFNWSVGIWAPELVPDLCKKISVDTIEELPGRVRNAVKRNGIHDLYSLITSYKGDGLSSCVQIRERAREEIGEFINHLTAAKVRMLLSKKLEEEAVHNAAVNAVGNAEATNTSRRPTEPPGVKLLEKLRREYGFKITLISDCLRISQPRVPKKLSRVINHGSLQGREVTDEEKGVFLNMTATKSYSCEVATMETPKKYFILNNTLDNAALLVADETEVVCWFLADLPEDLQQAIVKADMHRLTKLENPQQPVGEVVTIMKQTYFCPNDTIKFRRMASRRCMLPGEYTMWRYNLPYRARTPNMITDDKIKKFFEEHLVNGKVYISEAPESRWIRFFSSMQGFTLEDLIEFYGYQAMQSTPHSPERAGE